MSDTYAVILAAGKGTRMKSKLYKVLHPVCGKPMIQHVVDASKPLQPQEVIVVVGHGAEQVQAQLGEEITYVKQEEQLGTGHAVIMAKDKLLDKAGTTLILYGDTPMVTSETLRELIAVHTDNEAAVTILTAILDDPTGYGRIVRNKEGTIERIVEQKDASEEEKQIKEINSGIYCFDNQVLLSALEQLSNDNAQGEYYLTDCIEIVKKQGKKVVGYISPRSDDIIGVNDRVALAAVDRMMRRRINTYHMQQGVTIIDPDQTYIEPDVIIGQDTILYPGTILAGHTVIGEDCTIGPHTELHHAKVGGGTVIKTSIVLDSTIGAQTTVGPFAYIRPGSNIEDQCRIGDFVEVKNSTVGKGSKIPHLSYVGDADIGSGVNMGCGSVVVNYDGRQKHRTIVEDQSFVGCNVNLIAPITIGKGSYIAAGSTIHESTPEQSFAIARERQVTKENYEVKRKK